MACIRREPLDLGFAKTTYEASYVDHKKPKDKVYRGPFEHADETRQRRRKPYVVKSIESLYPWKCLLPLDTFLRPKRITRTHPRAQFDPNFRLPKESNLEVIKTNPKVFMVPQICMNDITCPEKRKIILDYMYTTDWRKKNAEANHMCSKKNLPTSCYEDPRNRSLRYEYDLVTTYPPDWPEKCKEWDSRYPGHVVNQTEMFWSTFKYDKEPIPAGENPYQYSIDDKTRQEIRELAEKRQLRSSFDIRKINYTGYQPVRDIGPLRKIDLYEDPYKRMLSKEFLEGNYKPKVNENVKIEQKQHENKINENIQKDKEKDF